MSDHANSQSPGLDQANKVPSGISSVSVIDGMIDESKSLGPSTPVDTPSKHTPTFSGDSAPTIQISNTFHLHANLDNLPPNVILVSSDGILFALHHHRLILASYNNFGGLVDPTLVPTMDNPVRLIVQEDPNTLNVLLHCAYGIPCDSYHPTFECLAASLPVLEKYGLALSQYIARGTPLYNTILNYAPLLPIETYALAASYNLEDLAITASSYTLHVKACEIPQDLADAMGTKYLQRLHYLHRSRLDGLRELLNETPFPHVEKSYCSVDQRRVVSKAYHLARTQVFYDATPAMSRTGIEPVMGDLIDAVACPDCKESLVAHVDDVITRWMLFKRTI